MTPTVVQITALHVKDNHGAIHGLDLALPAGPIGALIGAPSDGTSALAGAFAGRFRPHGGILTVGGSDPQTDARLRARIGVLLHDPDLPDVGRVRDLLVFTRLLRGSEAARESWYEPLGLEHLASRPVASLDRWEARTVALGLALAVNDPMALVLTDPLSEVLSASADLLRPMLEARAKAGACVLVLTSSTRDAAALADDVATLEQGRIARTIGMPDIDVLTPGSPVELQVWCEMGRTFASALLLEPEVRGVSWASSDGSAPLQVLGDQVEQCARTVVRVALERGVTIRAMQPVIPSKSEVSAATAGVALAARQNAALAASVEPRVGGAR